MRFFGISQKNELPRFCSALTKLYSTKKEKTKRLEKELTSFITNYEASSLP